jgi:hypothetical protein
MKTSNNTNDKSWITGCLTLIIGVILVFAAMQYSNERHKPTPTPIRIPTEMPEEVLSLDNDAEYGCTDDIGTFWGAARQNGLRTVYHVRATVWIFDNTGNLITSGSTSIKDDWNRDQLDHSGTDLYGRYKFPGYSFMVDDLSDPGCRGTTYKVTFNAKWDN